MTGDVADGVAMGRLGPIAHRLPSWRLLLLADPCHHQPKGQASLGLGEKTDEQALCDTSKTRSRDI